MTIESQNPGDSFVSDIIAACNRLKQQGVEPRTLRVNPLLLTPERLPHFLAECERLGIEVVRVPTEDPAQEKLDLDQK